jgi:signal transduction histidine kinase
MKDEKKTKSQLICELEDFRGRTARLEASEAERKRAEAKLRHLNALLRAIRNVNHLIAREKDRDRLLQGACHNLVETRGYYNAWVALLDESRGLATTAEAGLGEAFLPIVERLKRGQLPDCARKALTQSEAVVTKDPSSNCADCPLAEKSIARGGMTVRLAYEGKVYGLMTVSSPADLAADEEERVLFQEVARDIAFALHSIEVKEERKRAERALQDAREYADSIIETVREPLLVLDAELRVVSANRSFYRTFKTAPQETQRQLLYELGNRQWDIPMLRVLLEGILPKNATFEDFEVDHEFPTIGTRTMVLNARRIYRDAGKTQLILLAIEDVTERKRAELKLRSAREELVRKDRLAVLGQLAGGVGHELRNPLGAIKNAAYFLNMALEKPEPEVKETLEILEKEVGMSERIISSLLGFACPKPPRQRKVGVNEALQEALSRTTVPENVNVAIQLDKALPAILGDPDQLGQVFGNIILNAIQAMPEGGQLAVKSESPSGEWVSISLTDTGEGIPEENLEKLFEPLFTTKARGIGLGLALTKTMVEGHGGSIEVASEVGKGSIFTVKLPVSGEEKK